MAEEDVAERLEVELHCPECGAAVVIGIWDQSARCAYCASLLVCDRVLGEEIFVVGNATPDALDVVALLVRTETESYRNELIGRTRNEEGLHLDLPPLLDLRVETFRAKLEASLEAVDAIDFLVPYELHERTVMQGVLGRRGAAKESFVQSFRTEDLRRLYDGARLNLRDRGLKIRGSRLALLSDSRRANGGERFLENGAEATPSRVAPLADRARFRIDGDAQVIAQVEGVVRERHLRLWKHMSAVRVRRAGAPEDYLIDRQFDTVAGRLAAAEASHFHKLPERRIDAVVPKHSLRTLASECPNCGADLALTPRARVAFCANCRLAIRVAAEGLSACPYAVGELPRTSGGQRALGFPFWSLPFRVRAGGREWTRVWDWLEAVSPQAAALRFREQDPAESRLFIPARAIFGSRELDAAWGALTATSTWRQPQLRNERVSPADTLPVLDVELDAGEAAALARFALVALHDAQSTRSLNGLSFRKLVADAEWLGGDAELAVLPLLIHDGHWIPCPHDAPPDPGLAPPGMRPVPEALLADDGAVPRISRAFSLV